MRGSHTGTPHYERRIDYFALGQSMRAPENEILSHHRLIIMLRMPSIPNRRPNSERSDHR